MENKFELKSILECYKADSYDKAMLFTGKKYEVLVLPYNHGKPELFLRKLATNEQFVEVYGGGGSSCGKDRSWNFQDVYSEHETYLRFFNLYTDGSLGFLDSSSTTREFMTVKELTEKDITSLKYVPVPESIIFEDILVNAHKNIMITVERPEIHWGYDTFRVHLMNTAGTICESLNVKSVVRYRDGGTTIIETEKGVIFIPTSFNKDKTPTWTPTNETEIQLELLSVVDNKILVEMLNAKLGVNWPIVKRKQS